MKFPLKKKGRQIFSPRKERLSGGNFTEKGLALVQEMSYLESDSSESRTPSTVEKNLYRISEPQDMALDSYSFFDSNLLCLIASSDDNENTIGHSQLVAKYSLFLAGELGIRDGNFLAEVEKGAVLHDIGKAQIAKAVLCKPGPLSESEMGLIKEHPFMGYEMIEEFSNLKKAARVVLFHHEWYDGSGYPYGLQGQDIPLEARIFAIADTLDAITSDRPYRKRQGFEKAYGEILKGRGNQFDPYIADAFLSIPKGRWEQIKTETENALHFVTIH